ncbi:MAG: class II aldolase/adducin family protein [Bacillota bacterium]|nr:class II aldolase/adducin family protein [Bacillota bacterium]
MELLEAKKQVIKAGIELSESGLIARTWGNVSCRTDEDHFAITASGRNYLTLTEDEVIEVSMEDLSYEGDIKPSSENKLHREVYRIRPDVNFVIHTHQSNASAVAAMGLPGVKFDKDYPGIGHFVLVAEYGLPGTKKLCKNTAKTVNEYDSKAVIMSNHGALCYGESYEEAFEIARTLEEACGKFLESIGVPAWKEQSAADADASADAQESADEPIWNDDPAIMKYMNARDVLKPHLDDFAQLAGPSLKIIDQDDKKADKLIEKAIAEGHPLLVRGKGALCAAEERGDAEALSIVIEKNCRAALAAIGGKPINHVECVLMRQIYLNKYSKQSKK